MVRHLSLAGQDPDLPDDMRPLTDTSPRGWFTMLVNGVGRGSTDLVRACQKQLYRLGYIVVPIVHPDDAALIVLFIAMVWAVRRRDFQGAAKHRKAIRVRKWTVLAPPNWPSAPEGGRS